MHDLGYDHEYFDAIGAGSGRSARAVLPHVLRAVEPASVLDVGCGTGAWLAACLELGVTDVFGVDGAYVDDAQLLIPSDRFAAADLEAPLDLRRRFDVAMSLEVAEHLPAWAAPRFVDTLARHADVVVFSAAVPRQGGHQHVNEQWPEFWAELFADRGYVAVDHLRPRIWHDPRVEVWYAQNLVLYVDEVRLRALPALRPDVKARGAALAAVHPRLWDLYRPWSRDLSHADPAVPLPGPVPADPEDVDIVVLSTDRPEHLDRLLRSARASSAWESASWTVVYDGAAEGYERVRRLHPEPTYVRLEDHPATAARDLVLERLGGRASVALIGDAHVFSTGDSRPAAGLRTLAREDLVPRLRREGLGDPAVWSVPRATAQGDPAAVQRFVAGERLSPYAAEWEPAPVPPRALVCVAYADEVLEHPELLVAYGGAVSQADDMTLVIYAPDGEPEAVAAELGPMVAWAGLEDEHGPDLELLCVPARDGDRALAATAGVVLTGRSPRPGFADLVHVDAVAAELLAEMARHVSAHCQAGERPSAGSRREVAALVTTPVGLGGEHVRGLVAARGHRHIVGAGPGFACIAASMASDVHVDHVEEGDAATVLPLVGEQASAPPLIWLGVPARDVPEVLAALAAGLRGGTTLVLDGLGRFGLEPDAPALLDLLRSVDGCFPGASVSTGPDCLTVAL